MCSQVRDNKVGNWSKEWRVTRSVVRNTGKNDEDHMETKGMKVTKIRMMRAMWIKYGKRSRT